MQSKVSWFKRGIIMQDLRTVGWIGIIYQITLLFALPLQLLMMHENDQLPYRYSETHSLFTIMEGFQVLLMFTVPIVLGMILFRYMHVKVSADFIHSLPVKRSSILNHHLLIGLLLLVVPIIITAIFIGIVHGALDLNSYFTMKEIVNWTLITILMNVFVFVMTALIGTVTGISAVQAVLTYIFLVFPTGILFLFNLNMKYFIFGFAYDYYFDQKIAYLTPIIKIMEITNSGFGVKESVTYLVLTIVFYLLAIFVYKKRHIEGATQAISFRYLKPVFKYGVTFCAMLLGGAYFGETQRNDFGWLLFGYFFGSIIGYVIAEMVLQKTWRVFKSLKWYLVYGVVFVAIGVLLNLDITGYEKKVPDVAKIERAYFGDNVIWFNEGKQQEETVNFEMAVDPNFKGIKVNAIEQTGLNYFDEAKNINSIVKLHQQLIADKKVLHNNNERYYRNVAIGYELKDGTRFIRQYEMTEDSYGKLLAPIYESQEYKYSNNELLRLKAGISVDKIRIDSHGNVQKSYETTDMKKIEEMIAALKLDILQEPYVGMNVALEPWGQIELLLENNQRLYLGWKKSYLGFDKWIEENGLTKQTRVVPEDIDHAIVIKNDQYMKDTPPHKMIEEATTYFENNKNGLKIVDPTQLEQCLLQTTWGTDKQYLIAIYYKHSSQPMVQGLEIAPSFVEQHFN